MNIRHLQNWGFVFSKHRFRETMPIVFSIVDFPFGFALKRLWSIEYDYGGFELEDMDQIAMSPHQGAQFTTGAAKRSTCWRQGAWRRGLVSQDTELECTGTQHTAPQKHCNIRGPSADAADPKPVH